MKGRVVGTDFSDRIAGMILDDTLHSVQIYGGKSKDEYR